MMAPERMCAPGAEPFSSHHDGDVLAFFRGQLLEADGRGQAPGAAADDHHVVFHGFAGTELGEDFFWGHMLLVGAFDNGKIVSRPGVSPCPEGDRLYACVR